MGIFSLVEELARQPFQALTKPIKDIEILKVPRPFRQVIETPFTPVVQFNKLNLGNEFEDDFRNFGEQFKEALFPGTTDTKAGKKARDDINKIFDVVESTTVRKVIDTAAGGLEVFGALTGQPEFVAAGIAVKGVLGFTDKAAPIAKGIASAIEDKDLKKIVSSIKQTNALLGEVLDEEVIEDEVLVDIEKGIDRLNVISSAEHNDRLLATQSIIQNDNTNAQQQVFIEQKELRAIETETIELEELKNLIAPPKNTSDMIEELVRLDRGDEMIKFVDDNLELFLTFSEADQLRILDTMLDSGLVDNLLQTF